MFSRQDIRQWLIEELDAKDAFPAYLKMRLVPKGPFVAAKVGHFCYCTPNGGDEQVQHDWNENCDRSPILYAVVNGEDRDVRAVLNGFQVRHIDKEEYELLLSQAKWDKTYDPSAPLSEPRQSVDFNKMKLGF